MPDLTVDGSFVTGAAFSSMACVAGHPFLGLGLAFGGGALAGLATGFLHTKLKIQEILAGILCMTALYSLNLKITGNRPSVFFYGTPTVFTPWKNTVSIAGIAFEKGAFLIVFTLMILIVQYLFLKTSTGLALRATGDNEAMVKASSINASRMKCLGLMIANGLVALSGGLNAQYLQAYDHSSGIGMLVLGLASIIIGESLFGNNSVLRNLTAVAFGAILYRYLIAFAFQLGLGASDLKLFSSLIVILVLSVPQIKTVLKGRSVHARN